MCRINSDKRVPVSVDEFSKTLDVDVDVDNEEDVAADDESVDWQKRRWLALKQRDFHRRLEQWTDAIAKSFLQCIRVIFLSMGNKDIPCFCREHVTILEDLLTLS
ncbi:hypothetical protein JD844_026821 [Phrynosoma platyrhinos]|uniref:Uncharacterized protein n=1 Tax=Phrynosoma platyrhinos TaxID=52577 RepID=A0ABQ7SFH8_PHRPL|nr:hypothetical protein JD844_026821 [Phrynosoma platyrhinos]